MSYWQAGDYACRNCAKCTCQGGHRCDPACHDGVCLLPVDGARGWAGG